MSEKIYKVEIKTVNTSGDIDELIHALREVFISENIDIEVEQRGGQFKSFDPIAIILTIKDAAENLGPLGPYLLKRYVFDPTFNKGEKLITKWAKAIALKRHPLRPIHVLIKFADDDFEIITMPYLVNKDWIENFFENVDLALSLIFNANLLEHIKQIRLISENIDNVAIVCYQNSKPSHRVDLKSKKVITLTEEEIKNYADSDNQAENWYKIEVLRADLYRQMIERLENKK